MIKPPDFYCSNKFTFLKIDLEKGTTYNCHAARPQTVDFKWLEKNPGNLFNTDTNCHEREQMLAGQRNSSCEQNCYPAEDRGEVSTRMIESTSDRRYVKIHTQPSMLDITLFSDCNLSCSYCCKEYSTSWRRDLETHGAYQLLDFPDQDRYSINVKDLLTQKFSQKEKHQLAHVQTLVGEIEHMKNSLDKMIITGGEPLLNNHLIDVIHSGQEVANIYLFSGLGVGLDRFSRLLEQIKQYPNLTMFVSSENTGALFEFNRFGSTWKDFCQRVEMIMEAGIKMQFRASLSNLTVPGFADFLDYAGSTHVETTFVHHPRFMGIGNLDSKSKDVISESLQRHQNNSQVTRVLDSLQANGHTEQDRIWLRDWLQQFSQRKKVGLDCFTPHFLKWLQL
jgi:organic radical activating enzyme